MLNVLIRAGCFVAIIFGGWFLRRRNFLPEESFTVLSKIVINITLPAAIVSSTAGKAIEPAMLIISLLGLLGGLTYCLVGFLVNLRRGPEDRAFAIVNTSGYNIGNFAMPFTQSFLGPMGVVATSLFDVGNAFVCLGGAFGIAQTVREGKGFSMKQVLKALSRSVPFLTYVIMAALNLLELTPPEPVVTLSGIIGSANPFLGMLMVGVGFRLSGGRKQLGTVVRVLGVRYAIAAALAAAFYFLLPFDLEVRQALVLLVFSPIASAVPAFTARLRCDAGLSSAINSMSIVCSITFMVALLLIML